MHAYGSLTLGASALAILLGLAPAHALGQGAPELRNSSQAPPWRLIDSVRLEEHIIIHPYAYRIAVGRGPLDTIVGVLPPFPIGLSDSVLVGLVYGPQVEVISFFRYHLLNHLIERFPMPADLMVGYHDVCVSPDGRYVAYEAWDSVSHMVFAAVREWPAGALLIRGPELMAYPSDVDFAHARWLDSDRFQVAIEEGEGDYLWVVISGRVSTSKYKTQKLQAEPRWHERGGNYCPRSSP